MRQVSVRNKQTLLDLAIQEAGTAEAVFELAVENGISITDSLESGYELWVPNGFSNNEKMVLENYARKDTKPATGGTNGLTGINYQPIPTLILTK